MRVAPLSCVAFSVVAAASSAGAVTYQVGPTRAITSLVAVADRLRPGDVVEVDGGATYAAVRFTQPGAAGRPITVRGVSTAGGARPVIAGGANSVELAGDHYVFEHFEVRGGTRRCVYHHADDIIVRDAVVHDCPAQGILGSDQDSGSLLLEYVEVHHCGGGTFDHQIYMATDEVAHPGAVFRMQFCYVHDATGGNDVKSRAERNEIYYNWIEGALYHELELIGPDPGGAQAGWRESLAREDSDVVGNVLRATGTFPIVRVGGDGTGQSLGRYRFVNNTFVSNAGGGAVMRVFEGLESIEMHNNVFWATGAVVNVSRTVEAMWTMGEVFEGDNNWVSAGATNVPRGFRGTLTGAAPGFVNAAMFDLRPAVGSPLVDRGVMVTASPSGHAFTRPLALPLFHPPSRALLAPGAAMARPMSAQIDVGAYELATSMPPVDAPASDASADAPPDAPPDAPADAPARDDVTVAPDAMPTVDAARADDGSAQRDASDDAATPPSAPAEGCACDARGPSRAGWRALLALAFAIAGATRRRRTMRKKES